MLREIAARNHERRALGSAAPCLGSAALRLGSAALRLGSAALCLVSAALRLGSAALCLVSVALCLGLSACGAEFDPGSQVDALRVLAVHKSRPYVRPGEVVDLQLLWHDARPNQPIPQVAWVALCENPPGDLFQGCFTQVPDLSADELGARLSLPTAGAERANDRFSFRTSPDIIRSRPQTSDFTAAPYGLHYVFFAVCAGQLEVLDAGQFPFVCYTEADALPGFTAGDTQLDSRDFIIGYTAIFAYEEIGNENPVVLGVEFNGAMLWPSGAESAPAGALVLPPEDLCIGSSCEPTQSGEAAAPCPDELTLATCVSDCDGVEVLPVIEPSSAEVDAAASNRSSGVVEEQMWVNYYAAGGEVGEEVRLLNDATRGWNETFETEYTPSDQPGVAYVWAVAHDNRGGAEWLRLRVCTQ